MDGDTSQNGTRLRLKCCVTTAFHDTVFNIAKRILRPKRTIAHYVAQPFLSFNSLLLSMRYRQAKS